MIDKILGLFTNYPDETGKDLSAENLNDIGNKVNEVIDEINPVKQTVLEMFQKLGLIQDWVIESGSNVNGFWEKYQSGKLVQYGEIATTANINTAYGALYRTTGNIRQDLPIAFYSVYGGKINSQRNTAFDAYFNDISTVSFGWRPVHPESQNVSVTVFWEIIGRWKAE